MKQKLLLLFLIFTIPSVLFSATLFEDFNSHEWYNAGWSGRSTVHSWENFGGRDCMKVVCTSTAETVFYLRSKAFPRDDWQNVNLVRMDTYLVCSDSTTDIKWEEKDNSGGTIENPYFNDIATGTWVDCVWDVNPGATKVAWVIIIPDNLGTNECTYYFDNLRLVMNDGTTWYWDDFDDQAYSWATSGSAVTWSTQDPGVVGHTASTSTTNYGAGYLQWEYNTDTYAELSKSGINEDWSSYNTFKADVWCSSTSVPLKFWFWYGAKSAGENSSFKRVSSAETWETIYWPLPSGTTAWNVTEFKPGIDNANLYNSGTYYIDNITLGTVSFSAYKSTSAATGAPGDDITVTLTYQNSGDMEATNIYLTEAVPFSTFIPEAAASGNADSVEYYVGSAWQGGYDAQATHIRWKDNYLVAGVTGRQVSYKLRIK